MSTLKIDHLSTLEAEERFGAVMSLTRVAHVSGIIASDYKILSLALAQAGLPESGDKLAEFPNLVLTDRKVKVIDKAKAEVTLIYSHFFNEGQSAEEPFAGIIMGEVRANVQQITTNMSKEEGGSAVTVEYAYPSDYPYDTSLQGVSVTQGGEFQVYTSQRTINVSVIRRHSQPWVIARQAVGAVNAAAWSGGKARTWMCTAANWKPHDAGTGIGRSRLANNRYFFSFEFQYNSDTWDPEVVFIDPNTGKPPPDLGTEDDPQTGGEVGRKVVEYHRAVDFDNLVGGKSGGQMQGG